MTTEFALAVHGGAGTLRHDAMSPARAARYHQGLRRALAAGRDILAADDPALPFNCSGMYRGYVNRDGIVYTAIYDEPYVSA